MSSMQIEAHMSQYGSLGRYLLDSCQSHPMLFFLLAFLGAELNHQITTFLHAKYNVISRLLRRVVLISPSTAYFNNQTIRSLTPHTLCKNIYQIQNTYRNDSFPFSNFLHWSVCLCQDFRTWTTKILVHYENDVYRMTVINFTNVNNNTPETKKKNLKIPKGGNQNT